MILFEIDNNDSEFIRHLKTEANYAMQIEESKGESIRKNDIACAVKCLQTLAKYSENYTDIRAYLNKAVDFIRFGMFSPLTLSEGEFVYKKPGLAVNRRNPYICKDLTSVYYELAYRPIICEYYDAEKNINYPKMAEGLDYLIPFFKGDMPRVYIIKGTTLTNIYFDIAYLRDISFINGFFPKPAIEIPIIRYFIGDKYIDFCNFHAAAVNKLRTMFKLHVVEDTNEELKQFGIKFNIRKDALFSKGSTF